jgi:hypothetical protein
MIPTASASTTPTPVRPEGGAPRPRRPGGGSARRPPYFFFSGSFDFSGAGFVV